MTCSIQVNTKELLRALKNILALCAFQKEFEHKDYVPTVLISPQSPDDEGPGRLVLVGASSHIVAIEEIEIVNTSQFVPEDIDVIVRSINKTDVIDDLEKTVKAIGGTSKSKDAMITIEIDQGVRVSFASDNALLSELPAGGLSREWFIKIISWVDSQPTELQAPLMLDAGILHRFKAVRAKGAPATRSPNIDLVGISDHPSGQALVYRVGETLTGVLRSIDRDSFAAGGPWGDGYGSPKALISTKE